MADPNANILSLSIPTDSLTGAGGGNGLNFSYNFGPNADTITQNAYSFVASQAAGAFDFEKNSIAGTQGFLSAPILPIAAATANEADSYYSQILGAFGQAMNAQRTIGSQSINAQQQETNASISASRKSQKGGSLLGSIFGGCFITTAVCKYSHRPDDCDLLKTMRAWRDGWMQETAERRYLVREYYRNAPGYVDAILRKDDGAQMVVWHELERLITHACQFIKQGENALALSYYMAAVEFARVSADSMLAIKGRV